MNMYNSSIYKCLPVYAQNILVSAKSFTRDAIVKNAGYRSYLSSVISTQWFNRQELHQYQNEQLYNMLEHCLRHCEYYKKILPASIKQYRDDVFPLLASLPKIEKKFVSENTQKFIKNGKKSALFKGTTSGSNGVPLKVYQDYNTVIRESAFVARQLQWAGYKFREPQVWLRGDMVVPSTVIAPPYWRKDTFQNSLIMSAYHISPATCGAYISAIESFKPVLIRAYPSAIGALAQYLESLDRDIGCDSIRAIMVSSETLAPDIKNLLEKRFGAKVYNWYGSFERVAAIGTCEHGTLHVLSDYSHTEFTHLKEDIFSIRGSTFQNYKMPILRYTMNDEIIGYSDEVRCACGRCFPVVQQILGRDDDYVFTPQGYAVGRLAHMFEGVTGILGAQIFQDTVDAITICVVPASGANGNSFIPAIIKNARQRIGDSIRIDVEVVQRLQMTANGKIKFVISNVKR